MKKNILCFLLITLLPMFAYAGLWGTDQIPQSVFFNDSMCNFNQWNNSGFITVGCKAYTDLDADTLSGGNFSADFDRKYGYFMYQFQFNITNNRQDLFLMNNTGYRYQLRVRHNNGVAFTGLVYSYTNASYIINNAGFGIVSDLNPHNVTFFRNITSLEWCMWLDDNITLKVCSPNGTNTEGWHVAQDISEGFSVYEGYFLANFLFFNTTTESSPPPAGGAVAYIDNSTWNVTGAMITNDQIAWRSDPTYPIHVTDNTPTVYFETDINSNASCGIYNYNYTSMIADNPDTEDATGDSKTHSCTIPDNMNLSLGLHYLYYSVANSTTLEIPAGQDTSSSGPMSIYYDIPPQINSTSFSAQNYTDIESVFVLFNISDNNTDQMMNYTVVWYINDSNVYNETILNVTGGNYAGYFFYSNYSYSDKIGVQIIANTSMGAKSGIINTTILETEYFNVSLFDEWIVSPTLILKNISARVNYTYSFSGNGMLIFKPLNDMSGYGRYNLTPIHRPIYNSSHFVHGVYDGYANVSGSYNFRDTEGYLTNSEINTSDIKAIAIWFTAENKKNSPEEIQIIGGNSTGSFGLAYVSKSPFIGLYDFISFVSVWRNASNYTKYVSSNITFSCEIPCSDAFFVVINFGEEEMYVAHLPNSMGNPSNFSALTNLYKNKEEVPEFRYENGYSIGTTNTTARIFNGSIYDVRLFNKTLSSDEIQSLFYNNFDIQNGLLAAYPFLRITKKSGAGFNFLLNSTDNGGYMAKNQLNINTSQLKINLSLHQTEIYLFGQNLTTSARIYNATFTENISRRWNDSIFVIRPGAYNITFNKTNYKNLTREITFLALDNRTEYFNLTYNFSFGFCRNVTAITFYPNMTTSEITINTTFDNNTGNSTSTIMLSDYNATIANQTDDHCALYLDNPTYINYNISIVVNASSANHNMRCNPSNNDMSILPMILVNTSEQYILNISSNGQKNISCWGDFINATETFDFNVSFAESVI